MSSPSLPTLFSDTSERLNTLILSKSFLVANIKLKGLLYASWMRLQNWNFDIKDNDKGTLTRIEEIAPQTADIVRGRLEAVKRAVEAVEARAEDRERKRTRVRY
jgi:hypothetical protein